jgi:anti-sigma regulatory factor (Ser/Thr protein kinase)
VPSVVNPSEQEVRLKLACEPESVRIARDAVGELAERLGVEVDDVRIAVSEAVGNAIVHAYRGGDAGTITVLARQDRGLLLVTVADDGVGMMPNPDSTGLRVGIPLITKICDDVRFTSSDDGTTVSMSFAAPTPAGCA